MRVAARGAGERLLVCSGGVCALHGHCGASCGRPLWFLRDIIIYTAVAPLLHRLGSYLLWVGLLMLSLNYFALDLADHDYPIANSLGFFCWECSFPAIPCRI